MKRPPQSPHDGMLWKLANQENNERGNLGTYMRTKYEELDLILEETVMSCQT